jgi:signal transduction histidine kinase
VVEAIQATTTKHQIVVEGTVSRPVVGDGERLGQVLTNLLTNAVKYSPQANRIAVRLVETADRAIVEVEDFGIGIEPEHLDQIFDRFYRVTSEDEKTFPGLGMGLYISHEIVRRHGGMMEVTSVKGSGTVFRVTIPYGDGTAPDRSEGIQ